MALRLPQSMTLFVCVFVCARAPFVPHFMGYLNWHQVRDRNTSMTICSRVSNLKCRSSFWFASLRRSTKTSQARLKGRVSRRGATRC